MSDNLRLIIAFVVVMLVLFLWQLLIPRPQPVAAPTNKKNESISESHTAPLSKPQDQELTTPKLSKFEKETTLFLENSCLKITFSNYNAGIKSVYLKKYNAELVQNEIALITSQENPTVYNIKYHDSSTVIFEKDINIIYKLESEYILSLTILSAAYYENITFDYSNGLALTEKNPKDELRHFSVFYYRGRQSYKKGASRLKPLTLDSINWVALRSKYFTSVLSLKPQLGNLKIKPLSDMRIGYSLVTPIRDSFSAKFYFGPLDYDILRKHKEGWEAVMDWGWTRIFSLAILKIIKFLYKLVKNYGVAIIIFALIMKGVFYPLTRISNKQMRQMQLLQPKLEELKRKYKDDPQTLNRETMQLYRLYKINPFSGCLPLLFQLPIFWALYSVLQRTIELRG
ncbi:MAG: YidC/Oxa1 family insertase periplasmic-domain containing protein, partial [candidate division WOR-3 bacterium]|nr:YidC/Oxa1 family insertase periplasmic-domain containing protein [candidate division WOR-3 bacterium]MDW7987839.1 YidC/Oxa1 family insertase periplasmic-domain containing protein [candidate division WOR-3 bacterium]